MRWVIFFLASHQVWASCAGVQGCDPCQALEVVPGWTELVCNTSADCTLVETGCGSWIAVNRDSESQVRRREDDLRLKAGKKTGAPRPQAQCLGSQPKRCVIVR